VIVHTVRGIPHLAELSRQSDLDHLPGKIPQGKAEYGCPHEETWVQYLFLDPDEGGKEDEYGTYMLCNWKRQGDDFRVGVGLKVCWV